MTLGISASGIALYIDNGDCWIAARDASGAYSLRLRASCVEKVASAMASPTVPPRNYRLVLIIIHNVKIGVRTWQKFTIPVAWLINFGVSSNSACIANKIF